MDEKVVCPKCGKELIGRFCNNCGYDSKKKSFSIIKIKFNKNDKNFFPIMLSILTILICIVSTALIVHYNSGTNTTTIKTITDYGNVNITDTGIAESVKKVYDSVVVVETYVNDQLYATGTGFVFKEDDNYGYILTNNHVISNGTTIKVIFTDNTEVEVSVVGSDSYSDIAVLKVNKENVLGIATIGSSTSMNVGDTTFAVGAPVDASTYSWTVTRGILSGKDRVVEVSSSNSTYVMSVLQTDAAINSGNSGGPLCNANGEVIGITNMKINSSSVEGMGFAIPIETAIEYANNFIDGTPIIRPYIGISMKDYSANFFGTSTGVYVASVESGSPGAVAGLASGDIITAIDGVKVSDSAHLRYELYKHNVGDEVTITYTRSNKENTIKVTLGSYNIAS